MIKSSYNVIAVMSGTSLDGIDMIHASYVFENSWEFQIHNAQTLPYPKQWKSNLSHLVNYDSSELQKLDESYSVFLAQQINLFINKYKIKDIDFMASHGHTALHQPENRLTYQIGNLQTLADVTQQKVICDFRVQDVALGGQGAPLVPIGDRLLFSDHDFCLNLGGFANVSYEHNGERIAFDICPVNIVLNHYVSQLDLEFDDKGQLASGGQVNSLLLDQLNALNFYEQTPPKSLGLEWVKTFVLPLIDGFQLKTEDILSTFVAHTAIQISKVLNSKNTTTLVTGGGAYNDYLMAKIQALSKSKIIIPQPKIIEFKEALVFGLLGVLKERNTVNCLKSVTGASKDHSSGKILIPKQKINA